ncbi:zinc finger protein Rlf [Pangasianodon hypophthalmus]|uniref:zinc finger protein Rlf n=1 Tax=Pangasianodon hypophthalmus TaxID=310915 RepID=UPI0023079961|nr:zinc finger protein Rlf [Pangasianodon hypophthalmus]
MADESADGDLDRSGEGWADEDTFYAMESLQATLQHLEAALRQRDISEASSTEYCDNFCQALMHYAGSRNSVEHGLTLLEVYCLSINCFASARPHLTANSSSVALVLKRLALSCFELLLSVPQNEIPLEAWLQFHGSVQAAHEAMLEYGSTDLQALVQITGEGGAWSNPALVALLTEQPTEADELNAYLGLEGGDFLEMRIKHLEKVGEVEKALILTKACGNCSLLPNQATFRQTYVTQLCQQLPSEEAILEISRLDGKDVLDIICNMETEGDENTAFILCTTYLTQQLQKGTLYCSWELTLFWSKLQRRLDGSLESFLERCLQFGAIAKTVYHLLFLIRVIQTEVMHLGLAVSVELCVKALQLPRQEYPETKTTVCKTVACLLLDDLEVLRACQLTDFLLSPSPEVFAGLEDLYKRPDQKYDEENGIIPNSLRCELLLALKAHWPFDPEFWDWKTLKHYCMKLLGLEPEKEDSRVLERVHSVPTEVNREEEHVEEEKQEGEECSSSEVKSEQHKKDEGMLQRKSSKVVLWTSERSKRWLQYKVRCEICQKDVIESRLCHHARKHVENGMWTCPVCLQKCGSKDEFVPHSKKHLQMPPYHLKRKKVKNKVKSEQKLETGDCGLKDLEPGEIRLDPSSGVLEHVMEPTAIVPNKEADDDYITFDYISTHYKLQDREVYLCPATDCSKHFKLFKYLGVHLRNDHDDTDLNVKHYIEMSNRREKCTFCRRTFITAYHNQKHRRVHYGDCPYMCVVAGCNARFESINELIIHKHRHSFRLSYHCELKGCSLSFCDLGQLYHHEAQHFRDAAYTCTSPGCKKFYYSRQEFLKHIDTHDITFTEKDFEAQRKAKRKLLLPVIEEDDGSKASFGSKGECLNGEQTNLSSSQHLESKDSKGLLTCVAVCFDGKKFTCGLEKCGRTFSKASDIQKHLKIVHPSQFKKENTVCKTVENEKRSKAKTVKEHNGQDKSPTKGSSQEKATNSALCDITPSALSSHGCHTELAGALTEIVLGLNQLSLNSTPSRNVNHTTHASGSKVPQVTCPKTVNAISQTKVPASKIELGSHQAAADLARQQLKAQPPHKAESAPTSVKDPSFNGDKQENSLHVSKPFACEVEGCFYKSVTSHALMQHYVKKHDYTDEKVKQMDIFNPLKFKPFKCHLCSRDYKEKKELKAHLLQKHNMSKEMAEQILCSFARKVDDCPPSALTTREVHTEKKDVPTGKNRLLNGDHCVWEGNTERSNGKIMTEHKRLRGNPISSSQKGTSEGKTDVGGTSLNRRVSKRLMTKVKPDEDKPYCCLHKGCGAGFAKKFNLLRHLQVVHYHRSNLCWQKTFPCKYDGCNKRFNHLSSLNRHYRKGHPVSEDPIPRFKCTYPKCNATYHLKSSLMRHTNQTHQNQTPLKSTAPSSVCKFKDVYRRYDNSGPLVVRLQSTNKRERSNSGCQKKLIITSSSQSLKVSKRQSLRCSPKAEENAEHTEETPEGPDAKCVKPKKTKSKFAYRTPEEALQMCQDRCLSEAYPCMVQSCNSVVSSKRSLHRHYLKCHKMLHTKVSKNKDTLFYTAEQLEELIQKKSTVSALPDSDRAPNGVLKMEYQAEPENSGAPHLPMSLHSVKTEQLKQEASPSRDPPPDCSVMVGADDVLYGESNGHAEKLVDAESQTQEERTKTDSPAPPLVPPPPLDLSPPSTLRINVNNASLDPLNRDSKAVSVPATIYIHTNASLTRQPLRGKNSELSEPLPSAPHPLAQKDAMVPNLGQRAFDMAAYKPLGFESSFLKFIQEKEEKSQFEPLRTVAVLNPCYKPDVARRRDSFRHNSSVKENNLRRSGISHNRMSHLSPLKSLLSTEECSSIQNLRFILERALMGCGDQAIKQLQFLKPVVVLERPKSSASLLDLLPSETQA